MKTKLPAKNQNDWSIQPLSDKNGIEWFSSDDVIDAYFKGKQVGKQEQKEESNQIFFRKIEENIFCAHKTCENIFSYLNAQSSICEKVYLKMKNTVNFDAIFLVREEEWCKDEFDKFYENNQKVIDKVNTETFKISLIFMPKTEYLDTHHLQSDGYISSYPI